MRFDIITLFPELIEPYLRLGINRRAFDLGCIEVKLWQLRDYARGNYRRVDDRPFGGGPGMVMMAEPLALCLQNVQADRTHQKSKAEYPLAVVLFSPIGERLSQGIVQRWACPQPQPETAQGAVLICGRYEGIDQRFINKYVTHQISLGDFVLSGGEIAAVAFLDSIARLQKGVLNDAASHEQDSFSPSIQGLLDCPHYTRPQQWEGVDAPEVLMSGDHQQIDAWRHRERLRLTQLHRPELLQCWVAHSSTSR